MKGIILAGGSGTRLHPLTRAVSKQLLPIYNKPMVYYPLSTLMLAGIREILVITTPHEQDGFRRLLGDGSELGLRIEYAAQPSPEGSRRRSSSAASSSAPIASRSRSATTSSTARTSPTTCATPRPREPGATVFGYQVRDPERYGVVEFDAAGQAVSLEEKPAQPESSYAVTGLYFYDNQVLDIAAGLKPSARGELEITDVNRAYLERGQLHVEKLPRGIAWLDTGTHEALLQASNYIQAIEERQGLMVACLEEIAFRMGYITAADLARLARAMGSSAYGQYLLRLARAGGLSVRVRADRRCPASLVIEPDVHRDARGFFLETYHAGQVPRGWHPRPVRAGQPFALGRAARCAACTCRSAGRRASWCA